MKERKKFETVNTVLFINAKNVVFQNLSYDYSFYTSPSNFRPLETVFTTDLWARNFL